MPTRSHLFGSILKIVSLLVVASPLNVHASPLSTALSGTDSSPRPATDAPAAATDATAGYGDSFSLLREPAREYERSPENRYTYCVRSTATYECLSYGRDGTLRRRHEQAIAHGTAFAYRQQGEQTFFLTNYHVVNWPLVSDAAHRVEDVPAGCKRIAESLSIVDNEDDEYRADDIELTSVTTSLKLDTAVIRADTSLPIMPYRIGRSSLLRPGDVVMVRGFPLGAFRALHTGKVVNPYDLDEFRDWEHVDFIVDAPLSSGNSGSPVFAINARSGEYELVGVFHASYTRGAALNAVIAIEQLRDILNATGDSNSERRTVEVEEPPAARGLLLCALKEPDFIPLFSLGNLLVYVRRAQDDLLFEVLAKEGLQSGRRLLTLRDYSASATQADVVSISVGAAPSVRSLASSELVVEDRRQVLALLHRLYRLGAETVRLRQLGGLASNSRSAATEQAQLRRAFRRAATEDDDLTQMATALAERLSASDAKTVAEK